MNRKQKDIPDAIPLSPILSLIQRTIRPQEEVRTEEKCVWGWEVEEKRLSVGPEDV